MFEKDDEDEGFSTSLAQRVRQTLSDGRARSTQELFGEIDTAGKLENLSKAVYSLRKSGELGQSAELDAKGKPRWQLTGVHQSLTPPQVAEGLAPAAKAPAAKVPPAKKAAPRRTARRSPPRPGPSDGQLLLCTADQIGAILHRQALSHARLLVDLTGDQGEPDPVQQFLTQSLRDSLEALGLHLGY